MGFSLKGALKGLTKVASFVPGLGGMAASAGNAALNNKPILKSVGGDLTRNSKAAAAILPLAMSGGAAAGAAGAGGGGGGVMGMLKGLGGGLLNNADLLLGGASMLQGAKQDKRANELQQRMLALREQQYKETEPLRRVGLERMLGTQRPDLSAIYRNRQNPFGG